MTLLILEIQSDSIFYSILDVTQTEYASNPLLDLYLLQ